MNLSLFLAEVVLVATSFLATNLDNLLILVVIGGANPHRSAVLLGFLASSASILLIAALGVLLGEVLDAGLVGYLGLVPLGLGLYGLISRSASSSSTEGDTWVVQGASALASFVSAYALLLSNSGDSLALLLPLLADTQPSLLPVAFLTWLGMSLVWLMLVHLIGENRRLAVLLERKAAPYLPWVMIAVGTYILLDTATDVLV